MNNLFLPILSFLFFTLVSCEREIDIDLNSSHPRFVIEASLSDDPIDSCLVLISKTLNFNQSIAYPLVNNALVTITDNTNSVVHTLLLIRPGVYYNSDLIGVTGHRYSLNILIDNEQFTSVSVMPYRVLLDAIYEDSTFVNGGGAPPGRKPSIPIFLNFTDLKNSANYYQIAVTRNDTILKNVEMRDDQVFNGIRNERPIPIEAFKNDRLVVDLQCLDKSAFIFFFGLAANLQQRSATPSNPASNISNGALGYFKVHTSSKKNWTVQ